MSVQKTDQSVFYMLFIVGLILFILGFVLIPITEEAVRYRNFYGFRVPYRVETHPYQIPGVVSVSIGIILVATTIYYKHQMDS